MKQEHKILSFGMLAIAMFDTFGSIASRQMSFDYSSLSFASFIIYGATAFFATKVANLKTGVVYGAMLGLFDSTIGLEISLFLEAHTGDYKYQLTVLTWIITVLFMVCLGTVVGLIGGGLARIARGRNTNT
jgi:hypothetical protein